MVAYCVGLITTDGNLSKDGRHIEFTSKDIDLVEYVRTCFGPHNKLATKGRGEGPQRYFRIQFGDVRLYRWLISIGLSPRKSLTIGAIQVPDEFFRDFLRGHVDGDGNIYVYWDPVFPNSLRCYLRFYSASEAHLDWLDDTIHRIWGMPGYINSSVRCLRLSYSKGFALPLLRRIYYEPSLPCLTRKREIAERVFSHEAEVMKLVNMPGSGPGARKGLGVRLPPSAFSLSVQGELNPKGEFEGGDRPPQRLGVHV